MAPKRADLVLTTDVPHVELDVLIRHSFDVESDGRNGRDALVQLQLVEDR